MNRGKGRVFISATSKDLGSCRTAVSGVLDEAGFDPVEQAWFNSTNMTLRDSLRSFIQDCDAAVFLVGKLHGAEPSPPTEPRRSYTQMEYDMCLEMGKPCFAYLTGDGFDTASVPPEDAVRHGLQEQHRERVEKNQLAQRFENRDQLVALVTRLAHGELHDRLWPSRYCRALLQGGILEDGPMGRSISEAPDLFCTWETANAPGVRHESLRSALASHTHLALVGTAGSGKTVAMKRLLLEATEHCVRDATAPVPLWLRAANFKDTNPQSELSVERFIVTEIQDQGDGAAPSPDRIRELLRSGRFLVLLDGLDELPRAHRTAREEALGRVLKHNGKTRVLVSTRKVPKDWKLPEVQMPRLDKAGQERLIHALGDERTSATLRTSRWMEHTDAAGESLAQSPFYLAAAIELAQDKAAILHEPGRLLLALLRRRVRQEFRTHGTSGFWRMLEDWDEDVACENVCGVLAKLCYGSLQHGAGKECSYESLNTILGAAELPDELQRIPDIGSKMLPPTGALDSLLETTVALGVYRLDATHQTLTFTHLLWRDTLAAEEMRRRFTLTHDMELPCLAKAGDQDTPLQRSAQNQFEVDPLPGAADTPWTPACVCLTSLLDEPERSAFFQKLLKANVPLAACILAEGGTPPGDDLRPCLEELFAQECGCSSVELRSRLLAARALGRLGDSRLWEHADHPHIPRLVMIPAGEYRTGLSQSDLRKLHGMQSAGDLFLEMEETRPSAAMLAPFWISQHPVTWAHYAKFVSAGGYSEAAWWHGAADSDATWQRWQAMGGGERRPDYWNDPQHHQPNKPVTGITRFEAEAYCRWLSATDSEGRLFRLPTMPEWQAAARGVEGRIFPWGDEPDAMRCNCWHAAYLGMTSPVGIFPAGATPEGLQDMAGNVAEFCVSPDGEQDFLCGGSWMSPLHQCRTTRTRTSAKDLKSADAGFRLVACLPIRP